jgi:hypothetical protein
MIKQKVVKSTGIIRKLYKHMPQSVLISLYHTLVHPYFEYCNIVWAIDRTTVLNDLYIRQKKVIRLITNSKYNSHTKPLFKSTSILPLPDINNLQVACFVFRCLHNLLPRKFCLMFNTNSSIHDHYTRHSADLRHNYHRLTLRTNTTRIYGAKLWNSLTDSIRNLTSINCFKRHYKLYLLTNL